MYVFVYAEVPGFGMWKGEVLGGEGNMGRYGACGKGFFPVGKI